MALSNTRLGNAMADTILACLPSSPVSADETKLRTLMIDLADDIITEFIDNAEITSNGETETHTAGAEADIIDLAGEISA